MKVYKFLTVVIVSVFVVGLAFAQQVDRQERKQRIKKHRVEKVHMMRQKGDYISRIPNLSDEQKEEIKTIMLNTREEVMPIQNEVNEKRARLKTLRTADEVDMDAINEVIDEVSELQAEIMKQRLASEQEIRNLLTDDQRVVFDSRKIQRMHHRGFQRYSR